MLEGEGKLEYLAHGLHTPPPAEKMRLVPSPSNYDCRCVIRGILFDFEECISQFFFFSSSNDGGV